MLHEDNAIQLILYVQQLSVMRAWHLHAHHKSQQRSDDHENKSLRHQRALVHGIEVRVLRVGHKVIVDDAGADQLQGVRGEDDALGVAQMSDLQLHRLQAGVRHAEEQQQEPERHLRARRPVDNHPQHCDQQQQQLHAHELHLGREEVQADNGQDTAGEDDPEHGVDVGQAVQAHGVVEREPEDQVDEECVLHCLGEEQQQHDMPLLVLGHIEELQALDHLLARLKDAAIGIGNAQVVVQTVHHVHRAQHVQHLQANQHDQHHHRYAQVRGSEVHIDAIDELLRCGRLTRILIQVLHIRCSNQTDSRRDAQQVTAAAAGNHQRATALRADRVKEAIAGHKGQAVRHIRHVGSYVICAGEKGESYLVESEREREDTVERENRLRNSA